MRRLVIEADASEFAKVSEDKVIQKIKSLEVLHIIKQSMEEMIIIASIEFRNSDTTLDEVFNEPGAEFQILDHNKGKYIALMKSVPESDATGRALAENLWSSGGYMLTPLEIKDGKIKMSFLGGQRHVQVIPSMLKRAGIHYKILQLTDANLPQSSPLGELTEKQRKVLTAAYNHGYYDLPRRISSKQLASKLKIGSSDLIKHRRKAEKRILSAVLNLG